MFFLFVQNTYFDDFICFAFTSFFNFSRILIAFTIFCFFRLSKTFFVLLIKTSFSQFIDWLKNFSQTFNLTFFALSKIVSTSKVVSISKIISIFLNRDTIRIAFVIQTFRQIDYRFILNLSKNIVRIVEIIIAFNFRSTQTSSSIKQIDTIKVSFVESMSYLFNWATNEIKFRRDVQQFYNDIVDYKQFTTYQNFVNLKSTIQSLINNSFSSNFISNKNSITSKRQIIANINTSRRRERFRNENDALISKKNQSHVRLSSIFNHSSITTHFAKNFDNFIRSTNNSIDTRSNNAN